MKHGANFLRVVDEVVPLDHLVLVGGEEGADGITHPGVEMAHGGFHLGGFLVIEPTSLHLLGEGHEVRWRFKAPLLVGPVSSCGDYASLHFINNHIDALFLSQLPDLVGKVS